LAIIGANLLSRITSSDTELGKVLNLKGDSWAPKIQEMRSRAGKDSQLKRLIEMIEDPDQSLSDKSLQMISNGDENLRMICESLDIPFPNILIADVDFIIDDYVDKCQLFRSNKFTKDQITAQVKKLELILGY